MCVCARLYVRREEGREGRSVYVRKEEGREGGSEGWKWRERDILQENALMIPDFIAL